MRSHLLGALAAAACLFGISTQAVAQAAGQEQGPLVIGSSDANFDPNQPIKSGFQVSVEVFSDAGREDLSGAFQVDPNGTITLKLINNVSLKALTPAQASDKIAGLLRPYLKNPKVTVTILSVPKPTIFLAGGVNRNGSIVVNDDTRLGELLTVVGFTDNADLTRVRVQRKDDKNTRITKEYNFTKWLRPMPNEQADEAQNPVLSDKDFIFVPFKTLPGIGNVEIKGDVIRPGTVPIRFGVPTTLREVVSLAGGLNPTADRRTISLRRLGVEKPFLLDYDKLEAGDPKHDIVVQPDDIVYVQRLGQDKFINLNGAFVRPGRLPYTQPITLTQAIAEGGGLVLGAKPFSGRVYRPGLNGDPTLTRIIPFDFVKIRNNKQPDILLEPGDSVEVQLGPQPQPPLDTVQAALLGLQSVLLLTFVLQQIR